MCLNVFVVFEKMQVPDDDDVATTTTANDDVAELQEVLKSKNLVCGTRDLINRYNKRVKASNATICKHNRQIICDAIAQDELPKPVATGFWSNPVAELDTPRGQRSRQVLIKSRRSQRSRPVLLKTRRQNPSGLDTEFFQSFDSRGWVGSMGTGVEVGGPSRRRRRRQLAGLVAGWRVPPTGSRRTQWGQLGWKLLGGVCIAIVVVG